MSVPDQSRNEAEFARDKSRAWLLLAIAAAVTFVAAFPVLQHLLLGWIPFIVIGLASASYHAETMLLAVLAAAGFAFGLHRFLVWLNRTALADDSMPQRKSWHWRSSTGLAFLTLLLFVSGTAAVGLAHQFTWLMTSDRAFFSTGYALKSDNIVLLPVFQARAAAIRSQSKNNLKQIGLAVLNYATIYPEETLLPGGTYDATGRGMHSWMTYMLPYHNYSNFGIAFDKPWDAPENAPYFQSPIIQFRNPAFTRFYDEKGYALTHYAGSVHVMYPNSKMKLSDIKDGRSQTILGGEVNDQFVPWGSPNNFRDPARGINRVLDGFGGAPDGLGANMLFLDGYVRRLSPDTDPAVLRALSTPAGNDHVDGFDPP